MGVGATAVIRSSLARLARWVPPRRAEIALTIASLALGLLGLELVARVAGLGEPSLTGYAPVRTRAGALPRNAQGYRDHERSLAKPPGTHRLLVVGDSFAWGYGVHFDDAFPQRLERSLSRRRRQRWEVVNLAMPGMRTVEEAGQLEAEGFAYQPDVVLVGYVLNDSEATPAAEARGRVAGATSDEGGSLFDRSRLFRFVDRRVTATVENRRRVGRYLSMYGPDAPGWAVTRDALSRMGAACRSHGVPFVTAIFPLFGNTLGDDYPFRGIHVEVGQAAAAAGARVVDLWPSYRGLRWELLVVDGTDDEHPNEIAHRIAADTIVKALDDVLPELPRLRRE